MIKTAEAPRLLRYSVSQREIADVPAIIQIGRVFMNAQAPADLVTTAGVRTRRMMEQPHELDYNLDTHVFEAMKNLVRHGRAESMNVLRVSALAVRLHDEGKAGAPNGDHPKLSADFANSILHVLEREGFIRPEDASLVSALVRWHHGLGDVVLGRDGISESNIHLEFPTSDAQNALLRVVHADMYTWGQGRVWFKETIEPALPTLLPQATIYSAA